MAFGKPSESFETQIPGAEVAADTVKSNAESAKETADRVARTKERLAFLEGEEVELGDLKQQVEALKDGETLDESVKFAGTESAPAEVITSLPTFLADLESSPQYARVGGNYINSTVA